MAALVLSGAVAALAATASIGGLFLQGLYRDNAYVKAAWAGNDLVTLVVAVPTMIGAMTFAARGSARGELVWLCTLDYMVYNYAYYLFGAAFNWFFLLYVALFTTSMYALILGLIAIDPKRISQGFRAGTPVRWISGYMLFVALGLSAVYIGQSLAFVVSGVVPPLIAMVEHPTNVVFALDLSLLVPLLVLGAIWLLKRRPWGYVLSGIVLVKGAAYTLVLAVVAISAAGAGMPEALAELPYWALITVLGTIACFVLYWNLVSKSE
jgi:hypothetical protein